MTASTLPTDFGLFLSPEELLQIADDINTRHAPVIVEKKPGTAIKIALTRKQLLDISDEIARKYPLSLHASVSKLALLPIDPTHLLAAWNMTRSEQPVALNDIAQEQKLVLRIYPKTGEDVEATVKNDLLEIPVHPDQTKLKINLNPSSQAKDFQAILGKLDRNNNFTVLASSAIVRKPAYKSDTASPDHDEVLSSRESVTALTVAQNASGKNVT